MKNQKSNCDCETASKIVSSKIVLSCSGAADLGLVKGETEVSEHNINKVYNVAAEIN
ncbi:MAG: hypothetical protein HQ521_03755 [Bacteroidetes bacterium]|nr:hypothetical protein [Bacteroidota bacterium]